MVLMAYGTASEIWIGSAVHKSGSENREKESDEIAPYTEMEIFVIDSFAHQSICWISCSRESATVI